MRRLKQPEAENEKLVAERDLEIEIMKEINAKNGERAGSPFPGGVRGGKGAVAAANCTLIGVGRSALHYRSTKAETDARVFGTYSGARRALPSAHGYWRIAIFLEREGHVMGFGRCHRLWRQARLHWPFAHQSKAKS